MSLVFVFRFQYRKLSSQYSKRMNEKKSARKSKAASPTGKGSLGLGEATGFLPRWASQEQNGHLQWSTGFWGPGCLVHSAACNPSGLRKSHLTQIRGDNTLSLQTMCPVCHSSRSVCVSLRRCVFQPLEHREGASLGAVNRTQALGMPETDGALWRQPWTLHF